MTSPDQPGRFRVLIADDSEAMRRILLLVLSPDTFALQEVNDGQEALDRLESERFDLLLTDYRMPNLDGLQLVRALRDREAERGWRPTCVIVISGHGTARVETEALDAGADRVLTKPVQPSALLSAIIELLIDKT